MVREALARLNWQPMLRWMARQRAEVVLLFALLLVAFYMAAHLAPSVAVFLADRADKALERIEAEQTEQLRMVTEAFNRERDRDHEERSKLIDKLDRHQVTHRE